jgi:hypothetical protein
VKEGAMDSQKDENILRQLIANSREITLEELHEMKRRYPSRPGEGLSEEERRAAIANAIFDIRHVDDAKVKKALLDRLLRRFPDMRREEIVEAAKVNERADKVLVAGLDAPPAINSLRRTSAARAPRRTSVA